MGLLHKRSWQQRLQEFFKKPHFTEEDLEELEALLLEADIAPTLALEFSQELRNQAVQQKLQSQQDLLLQLAKQLEGQLLGNDGSFEQQLRSDKLQIIMLLGVNGVGKTTSLAKLVPYLAENCNIDFDEMTIGAGDTFRAAAIEQIKIHGTKLGVRVVAQEQGSDSAAVIHDAISSALARKNNLVLLDTAGRMHTKKLLLEELTKINRIINRLVPIQQCHNLIVLDATTGKNALNQAEIFSEILPLRGAIITKLDSKCGGGVVFSLSHKLKMPVLYEGQGEKYSQFALFNPQTYVRRLLGLQN